MSAKLRYPALLAALVTALILVQALGLEQTREKIEEDRYTKISDLKASRVLPQYIASLFLGSFRAIAVDVLWVRLRRMREEERRYFETVEIMDMISTLQPRNPEVWAYQGWDAAYNIANNVRDPEDQWKWMKYGFEKLVMGTRHLPDNPYLKVDLAYHLMFKATIDRGAFQLEFLKNVERDAGLQRLLRLDASPGEKPATAFELALPWLEWAAEDLRRMKEEQRFQYLSASAQREEDRDYFTTQSGWNIHPSTIDGQIRLTQFYNAYYHWRQGRRKEAALWFRKSAETARQYRKKYAYASPIYDDYARLGEALAAEAERAPATPEELVSFVQRMTDLVLDVRCDWEYLSADLGDLKRQMSGDPFEFNDDIFPYGAALEPARRHDLALFPPGDVDVFVGKAAARQDAHGHESFHPQRVVYEVQKLGDQDLLAEIWMERDGQLQAVLTREVRGAAAERLEFTLPAPASFALKVRALGAPGGRDPRYRVGWAMEPAR